MWDGEGGWWGEEEEGRQGKGNLMRGKTVLGENERRRDGGRTWFTHEDKC